MDDMYENKMREPFFKKDIKLEETLVDLNSLLERANPEHLEFSKKSPIVLIIGCPRSGSTLMMQFLASLGIFSYPSNLISRFYTNPYIGIRVQQALLEYDPLNQMGFNQNYEFFKSSLGKTNGALSPSEYWYFWRKYFEFKENNQKVSTKEIKNVEGQKFLKDLYTFEYLTQKPLVLKGMLLNWNIDYLHNLNKKFLFVNLERDSFYNAQSLLMARETFFNDRYKWYSFKPPEYDSLKNEDPITQVAGQVIYTKKVVSEKLMEMPEENVLNVNYNDFCENPNQFLKKLFKHFNKLSDNKKLNYDLKKLNLKFKANKTVRISKEESNYLRDRLNFFEAKHL